MLGIELFLKEFSIIAVRKLSRPVSAAFVLPGDF
jgi:hypothetical protein